MELLHQLTVLLVEDAGVMRKMEVKTLKELGITNIIEAEHGEDAINKIKTGEIPHVIISDWNMPVMDGYELLKWIRAEEEYKEIPFVMATGRGERKEVTMAEEAGVSAFISKPFNAAELKTKILQAIGELEKVDKKDIVRREPELTPDGKIKLKIAHIQITDHLVLGVLKDLIKSGKLQPKHFELETVSMSSWNPVADALDEGQVDGACVLAPIAMDLYGNGAPLKLILFAHKDGSIMVRNRKGGDFESAKAGFFKQKSFYIPHTLSIHNMLGHMFFNGIGLKPGVTGQDGVDVAFEVVPPVKMPEFLASAEEAAGYFVAEPLGTKSIAAGNADLQFLSSELWENHPCCVVTVQDVLVEKYKDAMQEFTKMLVQAGKFIQTNPGTAAEIGVKFLDPDGKLGLKVPLLRNVLTEPNGIKTNDLYPDVKALDKIQRYMHDEMGVGSLIDLDKFVELSFADVACGNDADAQKVSILKDNAEQFNKLMNRAANTKQDSRAKELLNKEGKYLIFNLEEQQYCFDIMKIREIIRMIKVRPYPGSPDYVLGVINLRGSVIPVMDSRAMFNMERKDYDGKNFIIVLEHDNGNRIFQMGIAVDGVNEVANITADQISNPPAFVSADESNYIMAIAKINERLKMIVDVEKVLQFNHVEAPKRVVAEMQEV